MAITLSAAVRNARAATIVTDAGTGGLAGKISVFSSTPTLLYTALCSVTLGTVAGGVLTLNAVANATAVAAGVAASATLYRNDGTTAVMSGLTVGTSGTNIVITNTTIAVNDVITTSSGTITEGNP